MKRHAVLSLTLAGLCVFGLADAPPSKRALRFRASHPDEARQWQQQAREKLFALMMGGRRPDRVPMDPQLLKKEEPAGANYTLRELTLQSLPGRRVHCWLAMPKNAKPGATPAMLALHGHGGTGEKALRGEGIYWYGKALAERGYVVIAPDIGSHELQQKDWTLMGQRVWDAMVCVDYLCALPEVEKTRIGTAGLSLGGETVMYVAAMDTRIKVAVSSGWLTRLDNMKVRHCPCWNFPGLEENFEFSDIFALVAPRALVLENGLKEKAPGGFPTDLARAAFADIRAAYEVFGVPNKVTLDVHDGGHVFHGTPAFEWIDRELN
ncbi:MAG: alpha/beta hydrolase family protein [Verrucomicrobiae bacterium]|nr:alpha/beta hydrolase family protein [Verrucomicrobiae bacterium]